MKKESGAAKMAVLGPGQLAPFLVVNGEETTPTIIKVDPNLVFTSLKGHHPLSIKTRNYPRFLLVIAQPDVSGNW